MLRATGARVGAITLVWGTAAATALAADEPPMFLVPKFPAGFGASSAVMADFDRDGRLDVAVSCQHDDTIALLLGRGDGTLDPPSTIAVGDQPAELVTADFNLDGDSDLAVANGGTDDVFVLLGAGDGSFGAPIVLPVGDGPRPLVSADVDGDDIPDLVVGNSGSLGNSTTVLLGDGRGGFAPSATVVTGRGPSDIAVADLDGDGIQDLVVTNEIDDDLSVLLGLGGGAFAPPVKYETDESPSALAIADFDADGNLDLAITCGLISVESLHIRYGLGDGSFGPANFITAKFNVDVVATDIDGDADTDLLVATWANKLQVIRNDGGRAFSLLATIPVGYDTVSLCCGDLDGDGELDVVAPHPAIGDVAVLRGLGDGAFEQQTTQPYWTGGPKNMRLVDTGNDGLLDVVTINESGQSIVIVVLRGLAGGGFAPPVASLTSKHGTALSMGDVDGDGFVDAAIASANENSVQIYLGAGDGSFVAGQDLPVPDAAGCLLVDLDGDTDLDLATVLRNSDAVRLYRKSGAGAFSLIVTKSVGDYPTGLGAGDLNGDGNTDLVVVHPLLPMDLILSTGPGTWAPASAIAGYGAGSVTVVDLDEDGALDLLTNDSTIYWGTGTGSFSAPVFQPDAGSTDADPILVDLTGDGVRDLVLAGGGTQQVSVLPGLGAGTFGAPRRFVVPPGLGNLAAIDLDGDQALDLLHVGSNNGTACLTLMLNRATMPWIDLHHGLAGAGGEPQLSGVGTLEPGTAFKVTLAGAVPMTSSTLIAGLSAINAPFKGGVMVPALDLVLFGLPTGAAGGFALSSTWPAVLPSGFQIYLQSWIADPTGPAGLTASNALLATTH